MTLLFTWMLSASIFCTIYRCIYVDLDLFMNFTFPMECLNSWNGKSNNRHFSEATVLELHLVLLTLLDVQAWKMIIEKHFIHEITMIYPEPFHKLLAWKCLEKLTFHRAWNVRILCYENFQNTFKKILWPLKTLMKTTWICHETFHDIFMRAKNQIHRLFMIFKSMVILQKVMNIIMVILYWKLWISLW